MQRRLMNPGIAKQPKTKCAFLLVEAQSKPRSQTEIKRKRDADPLNEMIRVRDEELAALRKLYSRRSSPHAPAHKR